MGIGSPVLDADDADLADLHRTPKSRNRADPFNPRYPRPEFRQFGILVGDNWLAPATFLIVHWVSTNYNRDKSARQAHWPLRDQKRSKKWTQTTVAAAQTRLPPTKVEWRWRIDSPSSAPARKQATYWGLANFANSSLWAAPTDKSGNFGSEFLKLTRMFAFDS
jgi:hypothetical protein